MITHTGEKSYKYDVCDKNFGHSTNLVSQKIAHMGDKPYKCDICDNASAQSDYFQCEFEKNLCPPIKSLLLKSPGRHAP